MKSKTKPKKSDIELAEQQIIGFTYAKRGYSIVNLAESMGMTAEEWEILKRSDYLSQQEVNELDDHFRTLCLREAEC